MARSLNPTFKKLTANQLIALSDVLRAHCHRSPEGAVYEDGWNDERVANEAIPEYAGNKIATVGHYRVALGFGRLRAAPKKESMSDRLAELEKRVSNLETLEGRASRLERVVFNASTPPAFRDESFTWDNENGWSTILPIVTK